MQLVSRKHHLWTLWLFLMTAAVSLSANDHDNSRRAISGPATNTTEHFGSSPFPPPEQDDTLFTVDSGSALDTDCTYHSGGPLIIRLPVGRYVGPVNGDGTLQDASDLVARRLLSDTAHLRMPAYDVDIFGNPDDPTEPPEIDRVYFNNHLLDTLTGDNDVWKLNEFVVPIEWIRFPSRGFGGALPTPAVNEIRIEIDVAGAGKDNWCTSVDWVELDFAAIAPIFLVHGILSNPTIAWPHFADALTAAHVPFNKDISPSQTGSIDGNALLLAVQLQNAAAAFGAKRCHVVAHSKGGLDMRAYLGNYYDPKHLRVLSLYTLSTPHRGSALADLGVLAEAAVAVLTPEQFLVLSHLLEEQLGFVSDLSTLSTTFFNLRYPRPPDGVLFYHYGADADANHDGTIDPGEALELDTVTALIANPLYHFVGSISSTVNVTFGTKEIRLWGDVSFKTIDIQIVPEFAKNDVIVTVDSAHLSSGVPMADRNANHASIKSSVLAREIVDHILADFPND